MLVVAPPCGTMVAAQAWGGRVMMRRCEHCSASLLPADGPSLLLSAGAPGSPRVAVHLRCWLSRQHATPAGPEDLGTEPVHAAEEISAVA